MFRKYDYKKIERKWQKDWLKKGLYNTKDKVAGKKNYYLLTEFPYPSGNLHVGHWYAFALPDIAARAQRMKGKNVLFPAGFDAFGLPAENAAIKRGLNPRKWTSANIKFMKGQLASMGASFDWSREVATYDPEYYKWTQWMFIQFLQNGLAYRKETPVNWCPTDKTVLANEQVVAGKCERCDTVVERRNMLQWNLRITDYAERLITDLEPLDWPQQIKDSQKNWIGKSVGAEIAFELYFEDTKLNANRGPNGEKAAISVFTTRPDTLFGATYLVLAPEHEWVRLALSHNGLLANEKEIGEYVEATKSKSDLERQENKEKSGVELEGVFAINPATEEKIPLFIADYVLAQYGTGAIMAVPAHDERDFAFAKKFSLPIKQVIKPVYVDKINPPRPEVKLTHRKGVIVVVKHWSEDMYLLNSSDKYKWRILFTGGVEEHEDVIEAAKREVREETGYAQIRSAKKINFTHFDHFYRLHKNDNAFVNQSNIIIELENGEQLERSEEEKALHQLSWKTKEEMLREITHDNHRFVFQYAVEGGLANDWEGVLMNAASFDEMPSKDAAQSITARFGTSKTTYKLRDWIVSRQRYWGVPIPVIHCHACGVVAVPEKDLPVKLPEIKDYLPSGDGKSPLAKADKWKKVRCPKCNAWAERETDTLDTFVDSSWYYLRYTDPKNKKQFADKKKQAAWMPVDLYSGGAEHTTMHLLYSRFWHKALYDLKLVAEKEPYTRRMNRGLILGPDGAKMSKSKGNVIDPDAIVKELGADTVRLYLAFIGPFNEPGSYPWNPDSVMGVHRFIERIWKLQDKIIPKSDANVERALHQTIKKVSEDLEALKFNTAISAMMIFINAAEKIGLSKKQYLVFLQLLAPFAPHISEELWSLIDMKGSIHASKWPAFKAKLLISDTALFVVQINGKMRGQITTVANASEEQVRSLAEADMRVKSYLSGEIVKVIFVPGKVINFVIRN